MIASQVKSSMHHANERNDLASVVLHKKDFFIANLEFRRIAYFHGFVLNRATEHANCVSFSRAALESVFHFEGYVTDDVALGTFANPLGRDVRHVTLKDNFGLSDQLIKRRRDYGRALGRTQNGNGG